MCGEAAREVMHHLAIVAIGGSVYERYQSVLSYRIANYLGIEF